MNRTRIAACSVVTAATAAAALALAAPAQAHVTVDPDEAEQGGYTTLNVRVPNESDTASTVSVEMHLDMENPLASVRPQAVPGWEVEVETAELETPIENHGNQITEAPSVIRWTGGEIEPGMFQQFPLSVGPLPETTEHLVLRTIQTYDDGEVARWIEPPAEDGSEPEDPAPVLHLMPAADAEGTEAAADAEGDDGANADAEDAQDAEDTAAAGDEDESATDTTARVLAGVGIAVGVAGVAFGVLAGRRRSPAADSAES
ncbi:YcnI family protein [Streptomyces sp. SBT349]|uniref:YcnI family copper-binding membrane protein n=1 Tax=Streptomyces sp. SBT349 TaxID=1580539 RepID=UPI00066E5AD0|nr:YcnI family protein [Streptomyces sp. SBT349]